MERLNGKRGGKVINKRCNGKLKRTNRDYDVVRKKRRGIVVTRGKKTATGRKKACFSGFFREQGFWGGHGCKTV